MMRVAAVQSALRFYKSPEEFASTIDAWVARARQVGARLVVFPEDIALPLICIDDYDLTQQAGSIETLARKMVLRHWLAVLWGLVRRGVGGRRSLFVRKAARMRELYVSAFSSAARRHELHVVAGSLPLAVEAGRDLRVYNTSYVFGPGGETLGAARKVDLIEMESKELDLSSGAIEDLPVFEACGVRFGVAICLDSWNPEIGKHLAGRGARLIASPQANPFPWTEEEKATNREGLFARCQELGLYGIQAMGVGELAGVEFEGQSAVMGPREMTPDGSGVLAEAQSSTDEELVVADIDDDRPRPRAGG